MAEQEEVHQGAGDEEQDDNPNYKPPAQKSLAEILQQDAEDESLRKYKEALLGKAGGEPIVVDPNYPGKVKVMKLIILVEGRDDLQLDLTLPKEEIKKRKIILKEGCKYRVRIQFYVQRDIVTGLKYEQKLYRKGIRVEKDSHMMGSYGPSTDLITYTAPEDETPSGLIARGEYKVESRFIDDDKNCYTEWEWNLTLKKDWD
ncbi:rho GDP-dissociation inhibitor 1-like [Pomacea canaliculata]|nr:rho GDP-dissociation inhibitor 1-like [Pomacea canaliculata]XP_025112535.1 rho GDP-dissociation inhibitor 1-like [Pomacea canaliculata]